MAMMTLTLLPVLLVMLLMLALAICVAVFVYKDAVSRGMPGILWAAVALLVPGLVGLLIYLVVRGNYSALRCAACGGPVKEQYMVCPHCGAKLRQTCPHCGRPLEAGWQCCAGCGQPVPADSTPAQAATKTSRARREGEGCFMARPPFLKRGHWTAKPDQTSSTGS